MNCPSCGKENKATAKFCKYCGNQIISKYKTCSNGHNYESNLPSCPYCPGSDVAAKPNESITTAKTVLDQTDPKKTTAQKSTISENIPETQLESELNKSKITEPTVEIADKKETKSEQKLLRGWLVSYELSSGGQDFRIYDGKTKIGRNRSNDIVLNDPEVSDEHVLLMHRENKVILQDLMSAKGTLINGKPVGERIELKDSDKIKIGKTSFIIKII